MSKKPNIVFLFSDQHNAKVMGCAGDPYIRTPNLDKLAAKGVRLTDCYTPGPLCVPSRMSMLTGRLPQQTNCLNNFIQMSSDAPTMAHTMTLAGYETVLMGRMHFCGHDQYRGFEKHEMFDATPPFHRPSTFKGIYGDHVESVKQRAVAVERSGAGVGGGYLFDEAVTDTTIKYLENREDDRPLFMTVGYFCPHPPYVAPKELFDYYYETLPEIESDPNFMEKLHPAMQVWVEGRGMENIDPADKRKMRAAYYALTEFMDAECGKVMDAVERTLGLENTIIIYSTDHGDSIGINDFYYKTHFFQASVQIPTIFSFPGHFGEGVTIDATTNLMDITHTINEIGGAEAIPDMHWTGQSLLKVLEGKEPAEEGRTVIGQLGSYPLSKDKPSGMVKKGDYKYISFYGYDYPSLYNLKDDPTELNDLGRSPEHKAIIDEMQAILDKEWDPQAALDICNAEAPNYQMLARWAETTKFNFPPLFQVENAYETNYLYDERYK